MSFINCQYHVYYNDFSMLVFNIVTTLMVQRRGNYANISLDVHPIINVTTMQRRRCCAFDSPGLARNEPTLGKHPQGDSTPSVLSFFEKAWLWR